MSKHVQLVIGNKTKGLMAKWEVMLQIRYVTFPAAA